MRAFVDAWFAAGETPGFEDKLQEHPWEQALLPKVLANVPGIVYAVLPHYFFNYFPTTDDPYVGQLVVHLMAVPTDKRICFFDDVLQGLKQLERTAPS
jgi:hypothetical protein